MEKGFTENFSVEIIINGQLSNTNSLVFPLLTPEITIDYVKCKARCSFVEKPYYLKRFYIYQKFIPYVICK